MKGDALFAFQPLTANVKSFDQVKVRLLSKLPKMARDRGWRSPSMSILVRVQHVGVVVFSFGVPEDKDVGEVTWDTVRTPVWPPKDGMKRVEVLNDVRRVVRTFLEKFPDVGLDPDASDSAEDAGTYYQMTDSVQAAVHRKPKPRDKKSKPKKTPSPQGVSFSDLRPANLSQENS